MNFDGHEDQVVQIAVGLVNALTPGFELGRQLPALGERQLQRRAGAALAAPGDLLDGDRPAGPELGELLRLAARLRPIFAAAGEKDVDRAAEIVNHLLAEYRPVPYLTRHDGEPWHVHFRGSVAGTESGLAAGCATALAMVVDSEAWDRLGVCSAPACDRVFVDLSRNGSRRFCSTACQNRAKAAAFRERRAQPGSETAGDAAQSHRNQRPQLSLADLTGWVERRRKSRRLRDR
jgi:CGNR zinc finger/Putative stress-induced transcription regulator